MTSLSLHRPTRGGPLGRLASWLLPQTDPAPIQLTIQVPASRLMEWLDLLTRVSGVGVTAMHAVGRATALAMARNPERNQVARGRRAARLSSVDLLFQIPGPDPADEARSVLYRHIHYQANNASVPALCQEMQASLLPDSQAPAPVSAVLTSLEASGVRVNQAPLPRGIDAPLSIMLSPIEELPTALRGAVVTRRVLQLNATFDSRLAEVHQAAALAREIRSYLEDPRKLETVDQFSGNLTPSDTSTELELPDPTESSKPV